MVPWCLPLKCENMFFLSVLRHNIWFCVVRQLFSVILLLRLTDNQNHCDISRR